MALIVEDGTGLPTAESYVSIADASAYHLARRNGVWLSPDFDDDLREAALVRATSFVDATYRGRFPGYPTLKRAQALEWPRSGAYVYTADNGRSDAFAYGFGSDRGLIGYHQGYSYIAANEIPRELKAATCEASLRELVKPGSLSPDLKEGGAIRSVAAGSANVTFAGPGASGQMVFQAIELALVSLLMPANPYSGRVARG